MPAIAEIDVSYLSIMQKKRTGENPEGKIAQHDVMNYGWNLSKDSFFLFQHYDFLNNVF